MAENKREIIKEFDKFRIIKITFDISEPVFIIETYNMDAMNKEAWYKIKEITGDLAVKENIYWLYMLLQNL
jgi:hypothetical protein